MFACASDAEYILDITWQALEQAAFFSPLLSFSIRIGVVLLRNSTSSPSFFLRSVACSPVVKPLLRGRSLQAAVLLNFPSTAIPSRLILPYERHVSRVCRAVAVLSNACSRLRIFANTSCAAHVTDCVWLALVTAPCRTNARLDETLCFCT